jgi:hypothetical protein
MPQMLTFLCQCSQTGYESRWVPPSQIEEKEVDFFYTQMLGVLLLLVMENKCLIIFAYNINTKSLLSRGIKTNMLRIKYNVCTTMSSDLSSYGLLSRLFRAELLAVDINENPMSTSINKNTTTKCDRSFYSLPTLLTQNSPQRNLLHLLYDLDSLVGY